MGLLVLAYPILAKSYYQLIQDFRKVNDELYYSVVEPHFTIVFPVLDKGEDIFIQEIIAKTSQEKSFDFVLRCTTINKDAFQEYYHIFLVPDEGFSKTIKLHDKLYSGILKDNHRLDIDYIPHIGIGNSKDKHFCKSMVDEWNAKDISIQGRIDCLTIIRFENHTVTKLKEIKLL